MAGELNDLHPLLRCELDDGGVAGEGMRLSFLLPRAAANVTAAPKGRDDLQRRTARDEESDTEPLQCCCKVLQRVAQELQPTRPGAAHKTWIYDEDGKQRSARRYGGVPRAQQGGVVVDAQPLAEPDLVRASSKRRWRREREGRGGRQRRRDSRQLSLLLLGVPRFCASVAAHQRCGRCARGGRRARSRRSPRVVHWDALEPKLELDGRHEWWGVWAAFRVDEGVGGWRVREQVALAAEHLLIVGPILAVHAHHPQRRVAPWAHVDRGATRVAFGQAPRLARHRRTALLRNGPQLGHPPQDVLEVWVVHDRPREDLERGEVLGAERLQLRDWKNAVSPVAPVGVRCVVHELALEPLGAPSPRHAEITHEESRAHLTQQVRHLPLRCELPHARVHKRVASEPARPPVEEAARLRVARIAPRVTRRVERPVGREEAAAPLKAREGEEVAHHQLVVDPICRAIPQPAPLVGAHLLVQATRR